jgi:hypothetical protein|tara:strand:- start:1424 stop:1654 length:231 start_codon:yes stop_codon:yes gene_type:complete
MGLLNKLENKGSQLSGLDGGTPDTPNFQQSTLHREYSTIGDPNASSVAPENGILPLPSTLERSVTPQQKYLNNLPG